MINVETDNSVNIELSKLKLLSITEAARLLGVGKDNVYALLRSGQLGFIAIGKRQKISVLEIQNFIMKQTHYESKPKIQPEFEDAFVTQIISPSKIVSKRIDGRKILEKIIKEK